MYRERSHVSPSKTRCVSVNICMTLPSSLTQYRTKDNSWIITQSALKFLLGNQHVTLLLYLLHEHRCQLLYSCFAINDDHTNSKFYPIKHHLRAQKMCGPDPCHTCSVFVGDVGVREGVFHDVCQRAERLVRRPAKRVLRVRCISQTPR